MGYLILLYISCSVLNEFYAYICYHSTYIEKVFHQYDISYAHLVDLD